MNDKEIINWLLEGDVSIQYQVHRDLFGHDDQQLRCRIANEGWGADFLSRRKPDGHWGIRFYQPKWTSTHYTLLDLLHLGIAPDIQPIKETLEWLLRNLKAPDGGIYPIGSVKTSDVCLNGMFLNYAAYFKMPETDLRSIVDFLIREHMPDGGFNCNSNTKGAVHSSLHTTLSVIEGIHSYQKGGYRYQLDELNAAELASREFILQHQLFLSDRTGEVIDKKMLMLSFPSRWRYDILRALDYFRIANVDYDSRMDAAVQVLLKKRRKDGRWPLQARHPGQTHFEMEKPGYPSRWNTLRALRVLRHFGIAID
jgi:hypothetical protein